MFIDPYGGVQGTPGYMYSWSGPINGQISNLDQIVNLYVGTYSVTVTDVMVVQMFKHLHLLSQQKSLFCNSYD